MGGTRSTSALVAPSPSCTRGVVSTHGQISQVKWSNTGGQIPSALVVLGPPIIDRLVGAVHVVADARDQSPRDRSLLVHGPARRSPVVERARARERERKSNEGTEDRFPAPPVSSPAGTWHRSIEPCRTHTKTHQQKKKTSCSRAAPCVGARVRVWLKPNESR